MNLKLPILFSLLLIAGPVSAADCSPEKQQQLQAEADQAMAIEHWREARQALSQLSRCQPQRGDLHIELLRLALLDNDRPAALYHRKWLGAHNLPPALEQLIDGWLARTAPVPGSTGSLRYQFTLGQGYDSNANDGSRHDRIAINFSGLPLSWALDESNREQASHYTDASASLSLNGTRRWHFNARARHYQDLGETELQLYAALRQPLSCPIGLNCSLDLSLSARRQAEERQLIGQLGTTLSTRQQRTSIYLRHTREETGADSQGIGLQWLYSLTPSALLFAGADYDHPLESRAGEDRISLHLGGRWQPLSTTPWQLELLHLREYEQEAYAPAFWGDTRRNRRLTRLATDYRWQLRPGLSLNTRLDWRRTRSELELYQQRGWSAAIQLISTH